MNILDKETKESLLSEIDFYFEKCKEKEKTPTVSGLAYHLGLNNKSELVNYLGKHKRITKRALLRIEEIIEEKLYSTQFDASSYVIACFFMKWCEQNGKSFFDIANLILDN